MAHILITDDDPFIQRLLGSRLLQAGHRVTLASDGREALARIEEDRPDAVFLDMMMPWMDGFKVLKVLRQDAATRELPVIMLTEMAADGDVFRGWWGPYEDYFCKPLKLREVMARLDWILHRGSGAPAVLVVTADETTRAPVMDNLSVAGLRAEGANSESEALERMARRRPDLVVFDQGKPGMDGLALLRRLRADPDHANLPVIVLLERETDASLLREWTGTGVYWFLLPNSGDQLVQGIVQLFTDENPSALKAPSTLKAVLGSA